MPGQQRPLPRHDQSGSRRVSEIDDQPYAGQPYAGLTHLGRSSALPASPDAATLDRVPSPPQGRDYVGRVTAPEFTSLCPLTGQPDFAHVVIDYIPNEWLVESKSLKLF